MSFIVPSHIFLREITLSDGPAINVLAAQCPDGGIISTRSVFRDNACLSLEALRPDMVGVGAEADGHEGLIGMAWVSFGHCRLHEQMVPYALLNTLMVHPNWRRQGVAESLSNKTIEYAAMRLGDAALILADIQAGNEVSYRWAKKWSSQMLSAITVAPVTIRRLEPRPLPGVTVGPVEGDQVKEFVHGLNVFYEGYNLFQPEIPESLSTWISQQPMGLSIRHCLTATDERGQLLAGLALEETHRLRAYHVVHMPAVLRVANRLLHVVPADGILREILVSRFWFGPGKEKEAGYLWQRVRWECRRRGTSLMAFFDPRGPMGRVIGLSRWSMHTAMYPVIRWEKPVSADRLVCPIP